ncbi:MAG: hypothetical protein JST40_03600 [Armatimonadetes bacterium]|nr:hypothetical protein [Armatimonadota bacterium]
MNETIPPPQLTDEARESYVILRESCGRVENSGRDLLMVTGNDRKGWLQGQATNDFRNLQPGGFLSFCFCSATGQLEGIYSLWNLENSFAVIADRQSLSVLEARLERMVILEDVRGERTDLETISIQGPAASRRLSEFLELPALDAGSTSVEGEPVFILRSNRTGYGGWVVLAQKGGKASSALKEAFRSVDLQAYAVACLEAGSPQFGIDTDAKTLPPELGPAFESANINYKKGCYMGQEVLQRIHSRGHVNRQWVGLVSESPMESGNLVVSSRKPDAGLITSAYESPDFGFIAGAMLRREVAFSGEVVTVQTAKGPVEAEVQEMPLLRFG